MKYSVDIVTPCSKIEMEPITLAYQKVTCLKVTYFWNFLERINIRGNSIFKKPAGNQYPGGFWGEKSRGANGFWIWPHLTLTGPLVKIGGLSDIFESYLYRYENMFYRFCNFSVTPFRQKKFSKLFSGIRVVGKGSWKNRSWTVLSWKVPSWKFLFEFERAKRNWRELSEVGKNWVKLEKFFRS